MANKDRKRYSREYKLEAVRRSFEAGKTAAEVARELDIPVYQLYKWRDEVTHKQEEAFPGIGRTTPNDELEQLRRENKRLKEERDILKKAWDTLPGIKQTIRVHPGVPRRIHGEQNV